MSEMKCPVCKTGNVEQGKHDKEYFCDNEFCPSYDETDSRTYDILIRTRKALDIANEKLKHCVNITVEELDELKGNLLIAQDALLHFSKDPIANNALKKITTPKQKEVK